MKNKLNLKLLIWRQEGPNAKGKMVPYEVKDISPDSSFLEMLDVLNENLVRQDERPIEFESDCREGICGNCSLVINGVAHGPKQSICTCQLHMRFFNDGDTITVEPFRAKPFPIIKDLVVDRAAMDRIISAGGYISISTGQAGEANEILIPKQDAENAMDSAACIGCGACVAACPNASISLFMSAKISHLAWLPQGNAERKTRVTRMVETMDKEGFGDCSNHGECEAVCPKNISIKNIAKMRREFMKAVVS
ncbi:MAG: succinate dehydrogenase/fumarate reductase iron-sulfur subunit [candidate division Zixibacteria bacterium]|nr:succinate dehydrogenase/fumarate reductase iron-sulfur subunit [candidate division Zixibacteria bacterium]